MMAQGATILWRRLDMPGHEAAVLLCADREQVLRGVAVLGHAGHVAAVPRSLALRRSAAGEWRVDGAGRLWRTGRLTSRCSWQPY